VGVAERNALLLKSDVRCKSGPVRSTTTHSQGILAMKKNTRAHHANPEPRSRRALRLSNETIRVLSSNDLANAFGGVCDSTTTPTQNSINNCPKPDSGAGGTGVIVH
jgi:hypothetical protein